MRYDRDAPDLTATATINMMKKRKRNVSIAFVLLPEAKRIFRFGNTAHALNCDQIRVKGRHTHELSGRVKGRHTCKC